MKRGIFLVRNYEKMKARQAFLLREGMREQEKDEDKESGQQSEGRALPTIKSGLGVCVVVADMCMCVCICYLFSLHHNLIVSVARLLFNKLWAARD